jgi:hypothetical protein
MITGTVGVDDHLGTMEGGWPLRLEHPLPALAQETLARLLIGDGIPFHYLVPDERLLPSESLRCFFWDWQWCRAAFDGVLAATTPTSVERRALAERYTAIVEAVDEAVFAAGDSRSGGLSGFLLRSALLGRYPALQVRASARVIRRQLLNPSVLLVLFVGVPDWFRLEEPAGELSLGLRLASDGLRYQLLRTEAHVERRGGARAGVLSWATISMPGSSSPPRPGALAEAMLRTRSAISFSRPASEGTP